MIGKPVSRVDGPLKVTGQAKYAGEQWEEDVDPPLHGYIVGAEIGSGRVASIDASRAEASPGVRLVLTHMNAPRQGVPDPSIMSQYARAFPVLSSAEIVHFGQPVALVAAATFEEARAAAHLVTVAFDPSPGAFDLDAGLSTVYAPKVVNAGIATDSEIGDVDAAFAGAAASVDVVYTTPYHFAQPMEPHAALAWWDGDDVHVRASSQLVGDARTAIAATLEIDPARVHITSPFVGGGFGSKLGLHAETILAILAARELRQPVKIHLTRDQVFQLVGTRPASHQHVRLAADRTGRLVALGHEVTMFTNPIWEYGEQMAACTRSLYAAPNRRTRHRLVTLNLQRGEDVRAPGEGPGLLVIESAMDELAHVLDMDPVELRLINEPKVDPERNVPFSERRLVDCLREGAKRFGWDRRKARPSSVHDGPWLVGMGMAAGIRFALQAPMKVKASIGPDGVVVLRTDMTDIGTGTYTIAAQVAADVLGLPIERIRVELGNSDDPPSSGSGGSWGAQNTCAAVHRACVALKEKLDASPGIPAGGIDVEGETTDTWMSPTYQAYSIHSYAAFFAEVGVDVDTGETRLRRMLGVFSAGRVLNPKTARSQLIGGMTFGIAYALHEEGVVDLRSGAYANRDLAQYLVPVNADIPAIDAVLLDGFDDKANILGAKGVGELGVCGSGAAVANAVFNATGVRVREFPITIEKVLPGLASLTRTEAARDTERRGAPFT